MCNELLKEVHRTIEVYENETGHVAVRTRQMISQYGPVDALSRLMGNSDIQGGFRTLRDQELLNSTFEALVVRYRDLFRPNVVEAAQWRLDNPYGIGQTSRD